jgi:geranylgeranyl pyrophosphate synthase
LASILEWNTVIKESNNVMNESISKYKHIFEEFLEQEYRKSRASNALTDKILTPAVRGAVLRGGKRIRPALALMSCEAVSSTGSYLAALPVALAFELAHCASLVQDDIFDNAAIRRNQPTVYQSFGAVKAVLSSDYLLFDIFRAVASYEHFKVSKSKIIRMISYICDSAQSTIEGELMDVALSQNSEVSEKDYINMIGLKTAKLFGASTALGALAGGASRREDDLMHEYGYNVGLAFQIMDDVLDIIGNIATTGKMPFKDLENNSSNIVIIHALTTTDPLKRSMVRSMLWRKSIPPNVETIMNVLNELGSIEYALSLAAKFNEKARKSLHGLAASPARDALERLSYLPALSAIGQP